MQEEIYGARDLSYSKWHRASSIKRFISEKNATQLSMIDVDVCIYVEYADNLKIPLALIEVAMDVGQEYKTATVTKNLANKANIPAIVLLYKVSKTDKNPSDSKYYDIESFRYKTIGNVSPTGVVDKHWINASPEEWANTLVRIREFSIKNLGIFVP